MTDARIINEIIAEGRIIAAVVQRLAREVFPDGVASFEDADLVFRLEAECPERDKAWNHAYADWLTEFYVWRAEPPGTVGDEKARHLLPHLMRDGRIAGGTELELLLNIVTWSHACSVDIVHVLLKVVWDSVTGAGNAAYGKGREVNRIDATDVEILRKAIYAPATAGGIMVSRAEAELLFDLNNVAADSNNHPSWSDLFVTAIANHLMFPVVSPATTTAEKCTRLREAWKQQSDIGSDIVDTIDRALDGDAEAIVLLNAQEKQMQQEHAARDAAIDAQEAEWLRRQIAADFVLDENEVELLRYLKAKSPDIHGSLDDLFAAAGIV